MKTRCVACGVAVALFLTMAQAADEAAATRGPGVILRVHINQEKPHPKAYHPNLNDLVQCTWTAPVVPDSAISDLKVAVDGKSVKLAGVVDTTPPKTVGVRMISAFFIPLSSDVTPVTFTPIGVGGSAGKPIRICIFPNASHKQ